MTEKEFAEDLEYLEDQVRWLGLSRDKRQRLRHLENIKSLVGYIAERLEADA